MQNCVKAKPSREPSREGSVKSPIRDAGAVCGQRSSGKNRKLEAGSGSQCSTEEGQFVYLLALSFGTPKVP